MNRHAVPNAKCALPGAPPGGATKPRYYDFDDGVPRLVKWHPSMHGTKACFNELVGARLGLLIRSPILRGCVVYVRDEIIPADHRPEARPGFHFGVAYMAGKNFMPDPHYKEIQNAASLAAAAVHLSWLQVGDRNDQNQYCQEVSLKIGGMESSGKYFRLVDMGNLFGSWTWDGKYLSALPHAYSIPKHLADNITADTVAPVLEELNAVRESDIRECFEDVPDGWKVDQSDKDAAIARAISTRAMVKQMIETAYPKLKPEEKKADDAAA